MPALAGRLVYISMSRIVLDSLFELLKINKFFLKRLRRTVYEQLLITIHMLIQ